MIRVFFKTLWWDFRVRTMLFAQTLPIFWWQWQYVSLFWCAITMMGQFPPWVCLKFPVPPCGRGCSSHGRWKRSFITAAKQYRVLELRREILARRKNTAALCLAHNLGRKPCPIRRIYMDRHIQMCSACTPGWWGTSQLQSRQHKLCDVLHSILPKCSIAKKPRQLHLSI